MMVAAVHQGDPHRRPAQGAHGGEAAETAAHDHDVRPLAGHA